MAISDLTPDTQAALAQLFRFAKNRFGTIPAVNSTTRTCDQQNSLYAQGRGDDGRTVTNAQGCQSWHVMARAVDLSLPGAGRDVYQELGEFWEAMGGDWGGRIEGLDDLGHFAWHPGYSINDLCPSPADCAGALARSRQLNLVPPRSNKWLDALGVGAAVFGTWWAWKRLRR